LHGPEELGYPALTEAMVNIRARLEKAVRKTFSLQRDGCLPYRDRQDSLFYKKRDPAVCRRPLSATDVVSFFWNLPVQRAGRSEAGRHSRDDRCDPDLPDGRPQPVAGFLSFSRHRLPQSRIAVI
jgi:hypothetical protein